MRGRDFPSNFKKNYIWSLILTKNTKKGTLGPNSIEPSKLKSKQKNIIIVSKINEGRIHSQV